MDIDLNSVPYVKRDNGALIYCLKTTDEDGHVVWKMHKPRPFKVMVAEWWSRK